MQYFRYNVDYDRERDLINVNKISCVQKKVLKEFIIYVDTSQDIGALLIGNRQDTSPMSVISLSRGI